MGKSDRYMLAQQMVLFGFFALVLVSIFWINRAVILFDRLVSDGQSLGVFMEFTMLSLPDMIGRVLPLAAFAGTVYVINRMSGDSELVVMQATGFSPWRLARPVAIFGLVVGLMALVLSHFLIPAAHWQLRLKEAEIAQNITAKMLTEGTFLHPAEGITFYIRDITAQGELRDIFLSDTRNPERQVTYTAARAYLVGPDVQDSGTVTAPEAGAPSLAKLVMVDGMAQVLGGGGRLSITRFADFTYDIGSLINLTGPPKRSIRNLPTTRLLMDTAGVAEETGSAPGRILEEAHGRFLQAALCLAAPLIGCAALLAAGFSRFGNGRFIILAIFLLVVVKLVEGAVTDTVRASSGAWPLIYLPAVVGLAMAGGMLAWASAPARRRREAAGEVPA